jgi:hypothetical protein
LHLETIYAKPLFLLLSLISYWHKNNGKGDKTRKGMRTVKKLPAKNAS